MNKSQKPYIIEIKKFKNNEKFINNVNNESLYETEISNNMWTKPSIEYFINWRIEVYDKEVYP